MWAVCRHCWGRVARSMTARTSALETVGLEMMIGLASVVAASASRCTSPIRPAPTTPTLSVPLARSMCTAAREDNAGDAEPPRKAAEAGARRSMDCMDVGFELQRRSEWINLVEGDIT
eukprot:1240072-Prymnesium_polylepis.2